MSPKKEGLPRTSYQKPSCSHRIACFASSSQLKPEEARRSPLLFLMKILAALLTPFKPDIECRWSRVVDNKRREAVKLCANKSVCFHAPVSGRAKLSFHLRAHSTRDNRAHPVQRSTVNHHVYRQSGSEGDQVRVPNKVACKHSKTQTSVTRTGNGGTETTPGLQAGARASTAKSTQDTKGMKGHGDIRMPASMPTSKGANLRNGRVHVLTLLRLV